MLIDDKYVKIFDRILQRNSSVCPGEDYSSFVLMVTYQSQCSLFRRDQQTNRKPLQMPAK